MMQFWLIIASMLTAALLCVLMPLLRRGSDARFAARYADSRGETLAAAIYRADMAELEREFAAGHLSSAQRERARHELERRLIDETRPAPAIPVIAATAAARAGSVAQRAGAAALLLALLPSAALVLYMRLGDPLAVSVQTASDAGLEDNHAANQGSLDVMVGRLAARLRRQPDDAAGWTMLARSYAVIDRANDAAAAYRRALELTPRDPQLLADYADALASANGGDLTGAPLQNVEAALALDPANPKALALAGSAAFEAHRYASAIQYWERLGQVPDLSEEVAAQTRANLDEARQLASGASAGKTAAQAAAVPPPAAAGLDIHVQLSPELAARARPGDIVFVYALAVNGPRIPLAVQRLSVGQLPATVKLDDSMAMAPNLRLSAFDRVTVAARVAASGSAQPASGDWLGTSGPLTGEHHTVELTIGDVRP